MQSINTFSFLCNCVLSKQGEEEHQHRCHRATVTTARFALTACEGMHIFSKLPFFFFTCPLRFSPLLSESLLFFSTSKQIIFRLHLFFFLLFLAFPFFLFLHLLSFRCSCFFFCLASDIHTHKKKNSISNRHRLLRFLKGDVFSFLSRSLSPFFFFLLVHRSNFSLSSAFPSLFFFQYTVVDYIWALFFFLKRALRNNVRTNKRKSSARFSSQRNSDHVKRTSTHTSIHTHTHTTHIRPTYASAAS